MATKFAVVSRVGASIAALLLCTAVLTGCGNDADDPTVTSPANSTTGTATTARKTIEITIADGKATPELGDVAVQPGEIVKLTVTSDTDDEIHAHTGGDGVELELTAGKPSTVDLTAPTIPGAYEVETHESGLLLFQLVVR